MVANTAVAHRIPAGWYRDKDEPSRRRWWDGIEWTDHYAPVTDPLTLAEPLTLAKPLLVSIRSRLEPVEHAVHSSEIPLPSLPVATPARRSVPLAVIVLLAGLTGANTVLLSILASGR